MYSEMKHIVFKNDYVIAVCKDKEVADLYVKFLEEKEKDSQRKKEKKEEIKDKRDINLHDSGGNG